MSTASYKSVPFFASSIVSFSFTLVMAAFIIIVVNRANAGGQGNNVALVLGSTSLITNRIAELAEEISYLQSNVTLMFNETTAINDTLTSQFEYLQNYTCQQIERINGLTPPCAGDFYISGAGNLTIIPQMYGIALNGTLLESQLLADANTITFIMNALGIADAELAVLNMQAIKTLNNVTVNATGNINLTGECGVDVYVSNVTQNVVIDTCRIENNVTTLIVFLNDTYYSIQNDTDAINATLISTTVLLQQLQFQLDALKPGLVTNINGQTPTDNNINVIGGDGIMVGAGSQTGTVQLNNTGVVTLNGLNDEGTVIIEAGPGTTVLVNNNDIIVSNTFADIFETPCTVRSGATGFLVIYANQFIFPFPWQPVQWTPFTANTKSDASCPEIFIGDTFTQPLGIWTVQLTAQFLGSLGTGTVPGTATGSTLSFGLRNDATDEVTWIQSVYVTLLNNLDVFGSSSPMYIVGQVTMNGYIIPPGQTFTFAAYYNNADFVNMSFGFFVQVTSIRIA